MPQWIVTTQKNKPQKTVATVGILLLSVFCFAILLFGFVDSASATGITVNTTTNIQQGLDIIEEPLGLPTLDIRTIIANIIRVALSLVGIVLVIIIMYGGFLYMTAGGNEEQIGRAKDVLKNAVIGLAIILSAYAIVLFIMKMLGVSMGGPTRQTISLDGYQNFRGSGALGRIVKDHYPMRDQKDVYRNTKIVVTFRNPVDPSSFIVDANEDGIFGNCTSTPKVCDTLNKEAIIVNKLSEGTEEFELVPDDIVVLAQKTTSTVGNFKNYGVHTIVLRPADYLGSKLEDIQYSVKLTNKILLDNGDSETDNNIGAFGTTPGYYEWRFTCGTEIDLTPPYVISTWPRNMEPTPKNTVIQIEFNEAIDPTGIQGMFIENDLIDKNGSTISTDGRTYFKLLGDNIFLKNGDEMLPVGNLNLTGGYRILEFTPTEACGENACGGQIFCLPVKDEPNHVSKYELILKAGSTASDESWTADDESAGVMDMASNVLDGNHDGIIQHATTTLPVFNEWFLENGNSNPDNYSFWFNVENRVDKTPPYLNKIYPGLDGDNIEPDQKWAFLFSKRMRVEPMYDIGIIEHPSPVNGENGNLVGNSGVSEQCAILKKQLISLNEKTGSNYDTSFKCVNELLWKVPRINNASGKTEVVMRHGMFLDKMRQFYIPYATSTVEDVNFNCFYPGKGPGDHDVKDGTANIEICDNGSGGWTEQGCRPSDQKSVSLLCGSDGTNCNAANTSTPEQHFGCNGVVGGDVTNFVDCSAVIVSSSRAAGVIDPPTE